MKKLVGILLVAFSAIVFTSCEKVVGEGPIINQERTVDDFTSISVSISGRVNYRIDPNYKVEIQAQQNILDILETKMVGNELVIKVRDGKRIKANEEIVVNISAPVARGVNLSGSAEFVLTGNVTGNDLDLRVSGSGNIKVAQVTIAEKINATISGSGNITVDQGTAKSEQLRISGSGNIDLSNVTANTAVTEISGSGNMKVNLSETLNAKISGSGSVYYRGTPQVSTQVSGSGSVRPL